MTPIGSAKSPVSPFGPIRVSRHRYKLDVNPDLLCLLGIHLRCSCYELRCRGILHLNLETIRVTGFSEQASSSFEVLLWRIQGIPGRIDFRRDKIIRSLESS